MIPLEQNIAWLSVSCNLLILLSFLVFSVKAPSSSRISTIFSSSFFSFSQPSDTSHQEELADFSFPLAILFQLSLSQSLPKNKIFLFMPHWYPPPASAVILLVASTSSLSLLLFVPSGRLEQLTHQMFFLHLQFSLVVQERFIPRVARKDKK